MRASRRSGGFAVLLFVAGCGGGGLAAGYSTPDGGAGGGGHATEDGGQAGAGGSAPSADGGGTGGGATGGNGMEDGGAGGVLVMNGQGGAGGNATGGAGGGAAIAVEVTAKDDGLTEANITKPRTSVKNTGGVPLQGLEVRYYFTVTESETPAIDVYYSPEAALALVQVNATRWYVKAVYQRQRRL